MLGVFVLRHGEVLTEGRMLVEYQILLAAVFVIVQLSERETSEVAFFAGNVRIGEVPLLWLSSSIVQHCSRSPR